MGDGPSQKSQSRPAGGSASGGAADAGILVDVVPDLHLSDPPQPPGLNDLGRLAVMIGAVLLGADLHDAFVLPGGFDDGPAFADRGGQRFLDVHVLAGLAGVDAAKRLPLAVGGHDDRVDVLIVEQLAEIVVRSDLLAADLPAGPGQSLRVQIADCRDANAPHGEEGRHQLPAASAAPNQAHVDGVIGAGLRIRAGRVGVGPPTIRPSL